MLAVASILETRTSLTYVHAAAHYFRNSRSFVIKCTDYTECCSLLIGSCETFSLIQHFHKATASKEVLSDSIVMIRQIIDST